LLGTKKYTFTQPWKMFSWIVNGREDGCRGSSLDGQCEREEGVGGVIGGAALKEQLGGSKEKINRFLPGDPRWEHRRSAKRAFRRE